MCGMVAFDVPRTHANCGAALPDPAADRSATQRSVEFCERIGIIEWSQSNRAYIMTHGVSSVEWKHYRHPLPDSVYAVYMKYWKDVHFQLHS